MISIAAAILLLLMSSFAAMPVAAEDAPAQVSFGGSVDYLSTGQTGNVVVHVAGVDGNYSWNVSMNSGSVTPKSGTTSNENFTVAVTAPSTTGDIVLTAVVSGTANATAKYTIHVIKPVVLTATVKNSGNLTLQNLPVQFIVDGNVVNEANYTIPANSTKTLTYNWTAPSLSDGTHTLKVILVTNQDTVRFIDGSKEFTTTFYKGDSGWGLANLLLTVVLVILLLVVFFSYMNKGRKRKT